VASVRSWHKLPLCLTEPVSDGSETELSLVKSEPISNTGRASVITYIRRQKTLYNSNLHQER